MLFKIVILNYLKCKRIKWSALYLSLNPEFKAETGKQNCKIVYYVLIQIAHM